MTDISHPDRPIAYPCGCVNAIDPASGVLRSVSKCAAHRRAMRDPATLDAAYYAELGLLDAAGELRPTAHVSELVEALGPLPAAPQAGAVALEVGCGVSPYVGAIQEAGWSYVGLDASGWAVRWMGEHWRKVRLVGGPWGRYEPDERYGLILAAHCFEHMRDAPGAIAKAARLLMPGGELWIVVPDDSDPVNPDHLWIFSEATLRATLEAAGLEVVRLAGYRRVPHEVFLYARARKPA